MKSRLWMVLTLIVAGAGFACLGAVEDPEAQPPSYWMKKKLEYSEKLLKGLADADFEALAKTGRSMNALSQMEKWVRGNVPEYRTQLQMFRNANEQLIRAAEKENLDGAALAYVQMTLSCVNCHKVIRDRSAAPPVEK